MPPALLAMVGLLSDRDAVDNAVYGKRWQLILETQDAESAPFGQGGASQDS